MEFLLVEIQEISEELRSSIIYIYYPTLEEFF